MATTTNLALHQWQSGDAFLREDFNQDLAKIDGEIRQAKDAAAAAGGYVMGNYQGDTVKGRTIELGFQPTAVIVTTAVHASGNRWEIEETVWMALRGKPAYYYEERAEKTVVAITEKGFCAHPAQNTSHYYANFVGRHYYYIAFR